MRGPWTWSMNERGSRTWSILRWILSMDLVPGRGPLPDFKPWMTMYESINYGISNYWSFLRHASKLNFHASEQNTAYHSINSVRKLKYKYTRQRFGDVRYSELELFDKGYHWKLECLAWRHHVGAPLRDSNMHGGRKPVETSGVDFGAIKTFLLSVKLEKNRIGTSLNALVTQNSKT